MSFNFMMSWVLRKYQRHLKSYKSEIIVSKDPFPQLEASESRIKDLFKSVWDEIKEFKYWITVKVLLSKHKENGDREFAPVYLILLLKQ